MFLKSDPQTSAEPACPFGIEASVSAKVNLADYQNSVPIIRDLTVSNQSGVDRKTLELRLHAVPPVVRPKTWRLEVLQSGETYRIKELDVTLDGPTLARLTEAESATLNFELVPGDHDEALVRHEVVIEMLPRNQWGGLSGTPEMVAAFVQPNEPAIERVLKRTAEALRASGKDSALNGYDKGATHAWELTAALWSAVTSMKLDYALPPASFELRGQKVRSAAQIADSGLATCLDLALMFCSALEQMGLNPLLIFTKGHAFVGVWLKPVEFSTPVVDDITALRKRVKLKELLVFETTLVTQNPPSSFSYATERGTQQIGEDQDDTFEMVVDIRRARLQRIKPLASAESVALQERQQAEEPSLRLIEEAPLLPEDEVEVDPAPQSPKDRLARWQRKLLDLSLRNNLLNFKTGKKAVRLEAPDAGALEDLLSTGVIVKLLPSPDLMDGSDPRSLAIYEARAREDVRRGHALDALKRREVFVSLTEQDMEVRLLELYRSARSTMQETGANTLFLACGFLSWTREDKGSQKYKAPLILIPVTLDRKSARSGFTLTLHDDEPRFNPTLIEMLRQDFELALGVAEGELPRDDAGLDVVAIWRSVAHAIKDIKGWEISEEVVLSMFSFAKYLMWKDLADRTDQLRESPVVRHLIDTPREAYPSSVPFPDPRSLDREFKPQETFCPLPADSSQLSAVMAAARGKDFVLIGPPGTGKSQTISNLIAQCLAEGKRVLFVSEKVAALDVVYRRLREVGLGEFCLELHSNKARKLDVLSQLQRSWDSKGVLDAASWRQEADRLHDLRTQLNRYVERLHQVHHNGLSIYSAMGVVVAGEHVPTVDLLWPSVAHHDREARRSLNEATQLLALNARSVGHLGLTMGMLRDVAQTDWSPGWQQKLMTTARELSRKAEALDQAYRRFTEVIGLPRSVLDRRTRGATAILARSLPHAAGHDWTFVFRPDIGNLSEKLLQGVELLGKHREHTAVLPQAWPESVSAKCQAALTLFKQFQALRQDLPKPWAPAVIADMSLGLDLLDQVDQFKSKLSVKYSDQIDQLNAELMQAEWTKASQQIWPKSALGKRKIKAFLKGLSSEPRDPVPEADIPILVQMRALQTRIAGLELAVPTSGLWAGPATPRSVARDALRLQQALGLAHKLEAWGDQNFDAVDDGRAGPALMSALAAMRRLKVMQDQLSITHLGSELAQGLWSGVTTDAQVLEAATAFQDELRGLHAQGSLKKTHSEVAAGQAGEGMAKAHQTLQARSAIEAELHALSDLSNKTASVWDGLKTSTQEIEHALKFQKSVSAALTSLATTPEMAGTLTEALVRLIGQGNSLLAPGGVAAVAADTYLSTWPGLQPAIDQFCAVCCLTEDDKQKVADLATEELQTRVQQLQATEHDLKDWCAWQKARQGATARGLAPLVDAIETGHIEAADASNVFEVNYARWWLNGTVDADDVIRTFVSAEHEKRIADFCALDEKFTSLTRAWVRARLCAELPKTDEVTRTSEWGILRHEINKKTRHLPLRELMSKIPTAVTKLTPCLLMSPLSIAQYLAAGTAAFDLVVFDEASQITVWDAIGAIARAKQVVMVGDPKQLPPTNFFDRAEADVDDEDVEGDLESILDECLGANLPTINLAWHYRSRSESLITFSNHRYYGGGLVTFPSPVTVDRAVSVHHVAGTYEKGGARINKAEAMALVADLVARLKTPGFAESRLTIGVVTFNAEQQRLIEDLLDAERRKAPSIEPYFSDSELEPVFVKNLESVQGDERDIMYFSITYGPDTSGVVSMNFGPMNRSGGERRLNVAITRARHELHVFSTLKAEQMDLSRTQAIGVRDLKHFLEFAERGASAIAEATTASLGGFESPFEEAVAEKLGQKGWILHPQIGASNFRVDLGVVHPDAPGTFLAGVECDGATYHRSATARDRDRLREQVLRGLGWEIVRIWSTDWWVNPKGTLDKVDARLRQLLEESRTRRAEEAEREAARLAAEAERQKALAEAANEVLNSGITPAGVDAMPTVVETSNEHAANQGNFVPERIYAKTQLGHEASERRGMFEESDPSAVATLLEPDLFFSQSYDEQLTRMVLHVVEKEGPVLDSVLARRIARAHGWLRTGTRIQDRVVTIANTVCAISLDELGSFYWPKGSDCSRMERFRNPAGDSTRPVEEVSFVELCALAREVKSSGLSGEAALSAMTKQLGLTRLGAARRSRLESALTPDGQPE